MAEHTFSMNNQLSTNIPPAQLWIGNHDELVSKTISWLQQILCPHQGCLSCTTCHNIRQQQHHAAIWLYPEKQYTLEQIQVIPQTIVFALEQHQKQFFIIQKADALTPTCSNSLLKSIEEPPHGYHFILLTDRPQELLTTIRSRCVEQSENALQPVAAHHALFSIFTATHNTNPAAFLKELETAKINERESVELLDQLLRHWIASSKKALLNNKKIEYHRSQEIIEHIKSALRTPPMPGSSNILWKDLYLKMTTSA